MGVLSLCHGHCLSTQYVASTNYSNSYKHLVAVKRTLGTLFDTYGGLVSGVVVILVVKK